MIQRAWLSKRAVIVMAFFLAAALAFGLRMPVRAARAFAITTDGNCFVTRGTDCRPEDAVEYAEPGETLHVHFVYEGCPEGMCPYYVLVNGEEVRGNFLNSGLSFTMPAQDVTIETVYVKQFTATWDLTGGEEVFEPNDPRVTLSDFEKQNMGTDMFEEFGTAKMRGIIDFQNADPGTGEKVLCFDLDRDGTWDAESAKAAFGDNYAAAKLPTVDGVQLGGFGGFKMLGVKPQTDDDKLAACDALAAYLTSGEVQLARFNAIGWGPSNLEAQKDEAVQADVALSALAAQLAFTQPQGQYPGDYWSLATGLGDDIIAGKLNDADDAALLEVLQGFETTCEGYLDK